MMVHPGGDRRAASSVLTTGKPPHESDETMLAPATDGTRTRSSVSPAPCTDGDAHKRTGR
ncbi:MAG: hypothetical protein CM1200mP2_46250 [Planctomycetaceae bacterium]|nr:MAG: hypothetical protein CM1200mP2_46250 [Planctomycetaceae bacterium]